MDNEIEPIPLELLPDSITVKKHVPGDHQHSDWQQGDFATDEPEHTAEVITIDHVMTQTERHEFLTNADSVYTTVNTVLLFIDAINSAFKPERYIPVAQDEVTFNGNTYLVQAVEAVRTGSKDIHHWEVTLA